MDLEPHTLPDLLPMPSVGPFSSRTQSLLRVPTPPPVPGLPPSKPPASVAVDCTSTVESPQVLGTWSARRAHAVEIIISLRCDRAWAVALAGLALVVLMATVALVIRAS